MHGFDLARGAAFFDSGNVYHYPSPRGGEQRFVTIGLTDGELAALVWTERDGAIRLISMRKARNAEKREYRARFG